MKESIENYLENIYILTLSGEKSVRSVDLAHRLGVTRPSVFGAISVLKDGGFIEQESYGDITLTAKGMTKAKEIYSKHTALTEFLMTTLGLSKEIAETDACKIEHDLSEETTKKLLEFINSQKK
ncbi:MAG TPA: metal-dependent transcriptional regulator [Clostridia bacterium]|nr:metal-dependent transcriptional regulator [Clostridia bacterium]